MLILIFMRSSPDTMECWGIVTETERDFAIAVKVGIVRTAWILNNALIVKRRFASAASPKEDAAVPIKSVSATERALWGEENQRGEELQGMLFIFPALLEDKERLCQELQTEINEHRNEINNLKRKVNDLTGELKEKLIAEEKKQCNDLEHRSSIALSTNQTGSMSNKCTLATSECRDAQRAELASRGVHITLYATRDAALLLCHRYYND
eukprot:scaffold14698_cov132-Skeletonema_marinoi.AAC.1